MQKGYTWEQGIVSFALTGVKDVGILILTAGITNTVGKYLGTKLGSIIGGSAAGPVGMVIGAIIGTGVGLLVDWLCTIFINWVTDNMK